MITNTTCATCGAGLELDEIFTRARTGQCFCSLACRTAWYTRERALAESAERREGHKPGCAILEGRSGLCDCGAQPVRGLTLGDACGAHPAVGVSVSYGLPPGSIQIREADGRVLGTVVNLGSVTASPDDADRHAAILRSLDADIRSRLRDSAVGVAGVRLEGSSTAHNALVGVRAGDASSAGDALDRVLNYVAARKAQPLHGIGDSVHRVHPGTEWDAELTFSDLCAVLALVRAGQ